MLRANNDVLVLFDALFARIEHTIPFREEWLTHTDSSGVFETDKTIQVNEQGMAKAADANGTRAIVIATELGNVGVFAFRHSTLGNVFLVKAPSVLFKTRLVPIGFITSADEFTAVLGGPNAPHVGETLKMLKTALNASEAA